GRSPPRAAPAAPGRATVAQGSGIREGESMKPSRRPGHASTLEAIMEYSTKPNGGRAVGRGARRGRPAALVAAGAALALAAATPALAQEQEDTRASGQSCYCVRTSPGAFWTGTMFPGRARLGVYLADEADEAGAKIDRVVRRSGAEAAGLRAGDIITAIDGRSVLEPIPGEEFDDDAVAPAGRVTMLLRDVKPGDTVTVEYLRDGERRTAEVVTQDAFRVWSPDLDRVIERAQAPLAALRAARPLWIDGATFSFGAEGRFGIGVTDLDGDLGEYFGTTEGVLVTRVDEDSPL